MTKEERQSIILELLIQHNSILVTDLATMEILMYEI